MSELEKRILEGAKLCAKGDAYLEDGKWVCDVCPYTKGCTTAFAQDVLKWMRRTTRFQQTDAEAGPGISEWRCVECGKVVGKWGRGLRKELWMQYCPWCGRRAAE